MKRHPFQAREALRLVLLAASCVIVPALDPSVGATQETAAGQTTAPTMVDGVVAVVETEPILLSDLSALEASLERQGEKTGDPQELLERKVEDVLVRRRAKALGVEVGDRELEKSIDRIARQNGMSREELFAAVAEQGLDVQEYRALLREQMLRMRIMQKEVEPMVRVDRADLVAYMKRHRDQFGSPPSVRLRIARLEHQVLADRLSECGAAASCTGRALPQTTATLISDAPIVTVSWQDLDPRIQEWLGGNPSTGSLRAFRAEGQALVVEYLAHQPGELVPLDQVEEQVRTAVRREKMERAFRQWLMELKADAWIERFPLPDRLPGSS